MEKKAKNFLFVLSVVLIICGVVLLAWAAVGQLIAQFNLDGQILKFRIVKDVSNWGLLGIVPLFGGLFVYINLA